MKRKINKIITSAISVMLSVSMTIPAFAYTPNGLPYSQGGAYPGPGTGGAFIVTLVREPNSMIGKTDKLTNPKFIDSDGEYIGDTAAHCFEKWYTKFPAELFSDSAVCAPDGNRFALFPKEGFAVNSSGQAGYLCTPNNEESIPYRVPAPTFAPNNFNNASSWAAAQKLAETGIGTVHFSDNSLMSFEALWPEIASGQGEFGQEVQNNAMILRQMFFDHAGMVPDNVKFLTTAWDKNNPLKHQVYWFAFYCAAAKAICSINGTPMEVFKDDLATYWQYRNSQDCPEVIYVACVAVAGQRVPESTNVADLYTFPAAITSVAKWNIPYNDFIDWSEHYAGFDGYGNEADNMFHDLQYIREKWPATNSIDEKFCWMYNYFGYVNQLLHYTGDSQNSFLNPSWQYVIHNANAKGQFYGYPGYGVFCDAKNSLTTGGPGCPRDPKGEHPGPMNAKITATPKNKKVIKGNEDSANIKVALSVDSTDLQKTVAYFNKYKSTNPSLYCRIELNMGFEKMIGNGDSGTHYDTMASTAFTKTGDARLVSPNLTNESEIREYLGGGKAVFELVDSGIKIDDIVKNKYTLMGSFVFSDGHREQIKFKGENNVTNSEGLTTSAWDYASFTIDDPDLITWYSSYATDNYVEIKDNRPTDEPFEAMAGMPTTDDCYVGWGANEFMVNVEMKVRTQDDAKRIYTINVTMNNCYDENQKCTISCGGHEAPETCPGGANCEWSSGSGCEHEQKINQAHPTTCTYTFTIEQKIDKFSYVDVTAMDVYRLVECYLDSNPDLFDDYKITIDPNFGFNSYYDNGKEGEGTSAQGKYESGNGRLWFSFNYSNTAAENWSDNNVSKSESINAVHTSCENRAVQIANDLVKGKRVQATAISDYITLTTSEGFQNIMYYEYKSNSVSITDSGFTVGSSDNQGVGSHNYKIEGNPITWPKEPDKAMMWDNNGNSFAKVKEKGGLTRSGYNGEYDEPTSKWDNSNKTSDTNAAEWADDNDQPNRKVHAGSEDWEGENEENLRLTKTGLNIIDSTDSNRRWSPNDSKDPVLNGEWDTGHAYLKYNKDISFKQTGGDDWSRWCNRKEVTYSDSDDKVNNIVIHNPVSAKYAVVLTNDKKYDQRTLASLSPGGDVGKNENECPRNSTCIYSSLVCGNHGQQHTNNCYVTADGALVHIGGNNSHQHTSACTSGSKYISIPFYYNGIYVVGKWGGGTIYGDHNYILYRHPSGCNYSGQVHLYDLTWSDCLGCDHESCGGADMGTFDGSYFMCTGELNTHVCTSACYHMPVKLLACSDPHHYKPGQPWNYNNPKSHYPYADSRCYKYCGNDAKHSRPHNITLPGGQTASTTDVFINIDREFKIYYPDIGDFEQQPNMWGIGECTSVKGKGYKNNMDTTTWLRNKYVQFPVNVIDAKGKMRIQGEKIDLLELPDDNKVYTFYAVLNNMEQRSSAVTFLSVGNNAPEYKSIDESTEVENVQRYGNHGAKHTAKKIQYIDVVGYIGALSLHDTGDFRFAELFKQVKSGGGWLVPNVVREVDYNLPNKIVADDIDVRLDSATGNGGYYHSPYEVTKMDTGGKKAPYAKLPLTPFDNPIKELQKQPMRPGYNLFMDIETVGNYYGETRDEGGIELDSNMVYKMQITPRYWELDLDTKAYKPVDVYMNKDNKYVPVVKFGTTEQTSEWYYYLQWLEESGRRSFTNKEANNSVAVQEKYKIPANDGIPELKLRLPVDTPDVLGSANRLFLNSLNRTFIGSTTTYGVNKNPGGLLESEGYYHQSQRWHFTLGLPSSSVFVYKGQPCTQANIDTITSHNSVIVCAIDIKVRGTVWTLDYNGTAVNNSDGGGFKVTPEGPVYPAPKDPDTGNPIDDPIIVVYHNEKTSFDDIRTEGTH